MLVAPSTGREGALHTCLLNDGEKEKKAALQARAGY
jgi:hypothetical protein